MPALEPVVTARATGGAARAVDGPVAREPSGYRRVRVSSHHSLAEPRIHLRSFTLAIVCAEGRSTAERAEPRIEQPGDKNFEQADAGRRAKWRPSFGSGSGWTEGNAVRIRTLWTVKDFRAMLIQSGVNISGRRGETTASGNRQGAR